MNSGETEDSMDPRRIGWDEFVSKANGFIESGELVKGEIEYKLEIACKVTSAREAVLCDTDNWADSLKKALKPMQPIHPIALSDFNSVCLNFPNEAGNALKAIWTVDGLSVAERISAFGKTFPWSKIKGGKGTRTTIISALLMGLDIESYPPFTTEKFTSAYENTGYSPPDKSAGEDVIYEHALGFLDNFIKEARAHGVILRHRLDAQSVVWHFLNNSSKMGELPKLGSRPPVKTLKALTAELLLSGEFLEEIRTLLYDKGQVIFQGPPGTGKTYVAQALANCLAGAEERVTLVQFHPSYAYEDFVRGFRPALVNGQAGFTLQDGPLLRAAEKARNDKGSKHFLIIDEINRGNLAKVFGELYFLLEYRDKKIRMQYQQDDEDDFSLPPNLYIIGTMNTADRSIALVDLALRRRFYFIEFHPDNKPVKGVLRRWLGEGSDIEWVADVVDAANNLLKDDKHAAIGPSYFMKERLNQEMVERIWKHSVLPYIEERLFGDDNQIKQFDLKTLCKNVAPHITWDNGKEQKDGKDDNESDGVNNATDQPTGVPREQTENANGQ